MPAQGEAEEARRQRGDHRSRASGRSSSAWASPRRARPPGARIQAGAGGHARTAGTTQVLPRRFGLATLRFKLKIRVLYVTRTAMPTAEGRSGSTTRSSGCSAKYGSKLTERGSDVSPTTRIFELHGTATGRSSSRSARPAGSSRSPPGCSPEIDFAGGLRLATARASRRAAACTRSCSCSTWRLSCCSERRRWPRTVREREQLGDRARDRRSRRRRTGAAARRASRRRARGSASARAGRRR